MSEETEEIRCLSQVVSRWWCQFTSLYWVTCSLNPSKTMIHFNFFNYEALGIELIQWKSNPCN